MIVWAKKVLQMQQCGSALNHYPLLLALKAQEQQSTALMFLFPDLKYMENSCIMHCRCTSLVIQADGFQSVPSCCICKNHWVRDFGGKLKHQMKRDCFQLSSLYSKLREAMKGYLCQNIGCLLGLFHLIH